MEETRFISFPETIFCYPFIVGFLCSNEFLSLSSVHDISAGVSGANNRSSSGFVNPPLPPQGHPNGHHWLSPMQGVRGYNVNLQSQVATLSRRISTISSSSMGTNPFQDVVDARPTFLAPGPPLGFRLYQPQQREIILDSSASHHPYPHLRVLPEDVTFLLPYPPPFSYSVSGELHIYSNRFKYFPWHPFVGSCHTRDSWVP